MGVTNYKDRKGKTWWKADFRVPRPHGPPKRIIKRGIPSKTMAEAYEMKVKTEVFEGKYFDKPKAKTLTVAQAWANYFPLSKQTKRSWQTDEGRIRPILTHLGDRRVEHLTLRDIDAFRQRRFGETTRTKRPPAMATINREVATLRCVINYAVKCGDLTHNPIAGVPMLEEDNVRQVVISESDFAILYGKAEQPLKPILKFLYDTGTRVGEALSLKRSQVDLKARTVRLEGRDTKTRQPRIIVLTERVCEELAALPKAISGYVFTNPRTGKPWRDIRAIFDRARKAAGMPHIWIHDLRRSFITNSRRRGIPESVVMRMSGHRTREVFERYNVVDEADVRAAVEILEQGQRAEIAENAETELGKVLDHPTRSDPKKPKAAKA